MSVSKIKIKRKTKDRREGTERRGKGRMERNES